MVLFACLSTIGVGQSKWVRGGWWPVVLGVDVVICLINGDGSGEVLAVIDVEYGDGVV